MQVFCDEDGLVRDGHPCSLLADRILLTLVWKE